jgi:hypothetical protein
MARHAALRKPARPAEPGERVSLGLRVTGDIKNYIDARAKETGRTQSQIFEQMVEAARDQGVIDAALTLAFGKQPAAVARLLAEIIRVSSDHAAWVAALSGQEEAVSEEWLHNPAMFEVVARSVHRAVEALRPPGDIPEALPAADGTGDLMPIATDRARQLLYAVTAPEDPRLPRGFGARVAPIVAMLGSELVQRIKENM